MARSRLRKWLSQSSAPTVETRTGTAEAEATGLRALAMAHAGSAVAQAGLGSGRTAVAVATGTGEGGTSVAQDGCSTGFGKPGLSYEGVSDSWGGEEMK